MKKALKIIVLLLTLTVLLSGCSGDIKSLELKNRIVIQGIGLDKSENGLSVSFQTLNTDVSSNPNSGSTPSEVVNYFTVESSSVSEALDKLAESTGMRAMISQNRIVVFGNELAKSGVSSFLDELVRDAESRETILLAVAEEKAEDVIYAKLGENVIPARKTEQIIESAEINFNIAEVEAYRFINTLGDSALSGFLPMLRVEKSEEKSSGSSGGSGGGSDGSSEKKGGEKDVIKVCSTAVFKEDKLITTVDSDITAGILWITDKVEKGKFAFKTEDGYNVTADIVTSKTRIKTEVVNSRPQFTIKVNCSVVCSEINDSVYSKKDTADIKKISQSAESEIKQYIENSIKKCIMEESADVFGFSSRLKRCEPSFYKENVSDWNTSMKQTDYVTDISVKIKRVGGSAAVLNGRT